MLRVFGRLRVVEVYHSEISLVVNGAIVETFDSTLEGLASLLNPRLAIGFHQRRQALVLLHAHLEVGRLHDLKELSLVLRLSLGVLSKLDLAGGNLEDWGLLYC